MTKPLLSLPIFFLMIAGLASCEPATEPTAASIQATATTLPEAALEPEIQWYDGTIEQAFILAESEQKPLFLYWGAIWCPPCEQIKATVFKHPAFLAKTELFVPVYMDGDTQRAQSWGDHFAVAGYPTMIVFSPSGDEITRIPGWIDSTQYINVLQLALDDLTSTPELLRRTLAHPESVDASTYTRLAFYSWEQANLPPDLVMDAETFGTLAAAAKAAGNDVAWSRLIFHSLYAAAVAHDEAGTAMSEADKQQAREQLATLFSGEDMILANSDYLLLYFEDFVPLLANAGADRDMLAALWESAMIVLREAPQLSGAEHIASWYPQIARYKMNHPDSDTLPADLETQVIAYINAIDGATRGEARQNVINTSYQVLEEMGRADLARDLLLAELEKSKAPYYFMSSLGDLAEKSGDYEAAVDWHRKAYENSSGEATRFQWGFQYVYSLVDLMPERGDEIVGTSLRLLEEFETPANILSGRNFDRLQQLLGTLTEWVDNHPSQTDTLQAFYANLDNLCAAKTVTDSYRAQCETVLPLVR